MGDLGHTPGTPGTQALGLAKRSHIVHMQQYMGSYDVEDGIIVTTQESGQAYEDGVELEIERGTIPNPGYDSPYEQFVLEETIVAHLPGEGMSLMDAIVELDKSIGLAAGALEAMGLPVDPEDPTSWPDPSEVAGEFDGSLVDDNMTWTRPATVVSAFMDVDEEIGLINEWIGKDVGDGLPIPWTSPLFEATDSLKDAIEKISTGFDNVISFTGMDDIEDSAPDFSSATTPALVSASNLEDGILALDTEVGKISSIEADIATLEADVAALEASVSGAGADIAALQGEDEYIRTFIGKGAAGSETPSYSSENYVSNGQDLEVAIGALDGALAAVAGGAGGDISALEGRVSTLEGYVGNGNLVDDSAYSVISGVADSDISAAIRQLDRVLYEVYYYVVNESWP